MPTGTTSATAQELTQRMAAEGGKGAGKNNVCIREKWQIRVQGELTRSVGFNHVF